MVYVKYLDHLRVQWFSFVQLLQLRAEVYICSSPSFPGSTLCKIKMSARPHRHDWACATFPPGSPPSDRERFSLYQSRLRKGPRPWDSALGWHRSLSTCTSGMSFTPALTSIWWGFLAHENPSKWLASQRFLTQKVYFGRRSVTGASVKPPEPRHRASEEPLVNLAGILEQLPTNHTVNSCIN